MPSRPPPEGPMTFRPCLDARADKTDLHAYDGDRPKLSHRTERRECALRSDRGPITSREQPRQVAEFLIADWVVWRTVPIACVSMR